MLAAVIRIVPLASFSVVGFPGAAGVAANQEYRYALWSYNPAGESTHVHIGPFYTTPAAPDPLV